MNDSNLYAFYGSLRRGMQNYDAYKEALRYRFSIRLRGYKMYALPHYPFVIRSDQEDSIVAEIFQITHASVARSIHELELSVGYFYEEVKIHEMNVGIYLFEQAENYPEVVGGDWVKFFGFR